MIEVHPGLFVGNNEDFIKIAGDVYPGHGFTDERWAVVHACKEPYHREFVGYTGKAAPPSSDEYLFARRGWRLALNLVDVAFPEYVKPALVDRAMAFIRDAREEEVGLKVLIHCNQGGSRSPSLALHWMRRNLVTWAGPAITFEIGEDMMRGRYPAYKPAEGIRGFVRERWNDG